MDIASSVYTLTVGIIKYLSALEDKNNLTIAISNIVVQIRNATSPLVSRQITSAPIRQCFEALHGALKVTQDHLLESKKSKRERLFGLINPWTAADQLREDRQQLMNHYILLMGSMQIVDHVKGYNVIGSTTFEAGKEVDHAQPITEAMPVCGEQQVVDFWDRDIGTEHWQRVKIDLFCIRLGEWSGDWLDQLACQRLMLRLDEDNTGFVSLDALKELVQDKNMLEVVRTYSRDPSLPLILWIDDWVMYNGPKVMDARKAGVTVIQLPSTKAAKAWITVNLEFLKKHDSPASLRFISDQVRVETNDYNQEVKNYAAGNEIVKFIREEVKLKAPILVYTGKKSIHLTQYVKNYKRAGSICENYPMYLEYVGALGARRKDDNGWMKYKA